MHRRRIRLLLLAPIILLVFIVGFGEAVLRLWNWLMPALFGLPSITFGQAWGLMLLSWILLGGFRGFGGPARSWRYGRGEHWQRWRRWHEMTPEQRAALREALDRRPGHHSHSHPHSHPEPGDPASAAAPEV